MRLPEILGTLTGVSLLGADAAAADTPILPIPEAPPTGDPWADVVMFALRIVGIIGAVCVPTLLGKYLDKRRARRTKGKES